MLQQHHQTGCAECATGRLVGDGVVVTEAAPPQVVMRRLKDTSRKSRLVMVRGEHQMQDDWGSQVVRATTLELQALEARVKKMP